MKLTKILSLAGLMVLTACASTRKSEELVIIHTNDTHSMIDPEISTGLGGIARRKVLIDSIRSEHSNVIVADAGDIVQGTLYFHLFKGKVEQEMLNRLGYDLQILGNHEFDNGMEGLKQMLSEARPTLLASNYEFTDPQFSSKFTPYYIKKVRGKKIGFMAVNLNPEGMVAEGNYDGVTFLPWRETAQATIDRLRNDEKVDYVVALTHIGYNGSDENPELFGDRQLAAQTSGIDLIIGGHSHTLLNPAESVTDAKGHPIIICQTGKNGRYIGEAKLNLKTGEITEKLIPVDSRLDARRDGELMAALEKYRAGVDSLYAREVGQVATSGPINGRSPEMQQFAGNFVMNRGSRMIDGVKGAISNKGGLRVTWNPGPLTEGQAIDMMPFNNRIVVLDILGTDLIDAFKVMDSRGGDISVGLDPQGINPEATYRIATIDYLANGGDYMEPLTRGKIIATSTKIAYEDLLDYLQENPIIK
ncbi:MAG: bifunctional metallophosphatase/5'-nucleotidase [Muribaculaceae bacterium]|nr:bifunctional metallophosphatase/5'-nucleotidase [Muribaculaceae bacterium]